MSHRREKKSERALAPLLSLLIEALKEQEAKDRPGEAGALRAFGELALVQVPSRGALAPNDDELYDAIDRIARKHLRLRIASKEFYRATRAVEPFTKRDDIESAANHFRTVSVLYRACVRRHARRPGDRLIAAMNATKCDDSVASRSSSSSNAPFRNLPFRGAAEQCIGRSNSEESDAALSAGARSLFPGE
jgi:hypothetical protein